MSIAVVNAHQLSRVCREPGYVPPRPGGEPPPAFLVAQGTTARAAVRRLHTYGPDVAQAYLAGSKVASWVNHRHKSLASGARAVVSGFAWYVRQSAADGRRIVALDEQVVVVRPPGACEVRIDVVLADEDGLSCRCIMWDGPDFSDDHAPRIASPFALAMTLRYPERTIRSIGVWQARRQRAAEVPFDDALREVAWVDSTIASI